jgi:hypothetical protein
VHTSQEKPNKKEKKWMRVGEMGIGRRRKLMSVFYMRT